MRLSTAFESCTSAYNAPCIWKKLTMQTFLEISTRIYIPLTLPLKECIQVRTKLSEGQLFTFRDRQDSCLPSAARLDSPEDQGKGKVGPRKVLFLQEYNFLQG